MTRQDLLKEMTDSVGNKDPIDFFAKMIDVYSLLFDKLDQMENRLASLELGNSKLKNNLALAINWDPKVAADLMYTQIQELRKTPDAFDSELLLFKTAYAEGKVCLDYESFCKFWVDTLGFHPFLDYK